MGAPPARAKPSVGESATDDNAADGRAKPRVRGMIRRTGPKVKAAPAPAPEGENQP